VCEGQQLIGEKQLTTETGGGGAVSLGI